MVDDTLGCWLVYWLALKPWDIRYGITQGTESALSRGMRLGLACTTKYLNSKPVAPWPYAIVCPSVGLPRNEGGSQFSVAGWVVFRLCYVAFSGETEKHAL